MKNFDLLIDEIIYLRENFLVFDELLAHPSLNQAAVEQVRQLGCMPAASYTMRFDVRLASEIFGMSTIDGEMEFFPKTIVYWLASAQLLLEECGGDRISKTLESRFKLAFKEALIAAPGRRAGHPECFPDGRLDDKALDKAADRAWGHFMEGTYGVCLHYQTPANVVRKHIVVATLEGVLDRVRKGQPVDRHEALAALESYEELGMPFAPHDRHLSSRNHVYRPVARHLGIEMQEG